jgi:hypothetical protein
MKKLNLLRSRTLLPLMLVAGVLGTGVLVKSSIGSDHQQTALTELNPRLDITDVWAFPGSTDGRIVLAATIASPIVGTTGARFDPNALYEFHIDNDQDGEEDVVLQFLFDDMTDGSQRVSLLGPTAPPAADSAQLPGPISGMIPGGILNRIVSGPATIVRQDLNTNLDATLASGALQLFAGVRDDPFYIDLEQFFRIIPDRRPVTGPLADIMQSATAWSAPCDDSGNFLPGNDEFDKTHGCPVDFLNGFNALAIIVELPEAAIVGSGNGQIGLWATISR